MCFTAGEIVMECQLLSTHILDIYCSLGHTGNNLF